MWEHKRFLASALALAICAAVGGSSMMQMHVEAEKAAPISRKNLDRETIKALRLGLSGGRVRSETGVEAPDLVPLIEERMKENEKSTGWLRIPGTKIDYPIIYDPDAPHNNYYTDHDANGEPDPNGTYFADLRAVFGDGSREDLALVTTLYGHSFDDDPDGELMSSLKRYRDAEFAREHPYMFFSTWQDNMIFEVIAVFDAHVNLPYIRYDLQAMEFQEMLDGVFASSLYDYDADIKFSDRLLVVSCCTMSVEGHPELDPATTDYRFAVMGRLVAPDEQLKTEAEFTINPSPAAPDEFKDMVMEIE